MSHLLARCRVGVLRRSHGLSSRVSSLRRRVLGIVFFTGTGSTWMEPRGEVHASECVGGLHTLAGREAGERKGLLKRVVAELTRRGASSGTGSGRWAMKLGLEGDRTVAEAKGGRGGERTSALGDRLGMEERGTSWMDSTLLRREREGLGSKKMKDEGGGGTLRGETASSLGSESAENWLAPSWERRRWWRESLCLRAATGGTSGDGSESSPLSWAW